MLKPKVKEAFPEVTFLKIDDMDAHSSIMATKRQEYDRKRYEIKQLKEGVNPRKYKTGELDKQLENAKQIFIGREMERNESKLREVNMERSLVRRERKKSR
jgi:hypothetical protein